jgi:Protein of unknown function (DUF3775)
MQSDGHAAVIARDPRDSKTLFAQSSRRVDFFPPRLERSSAPMDFAGAGPAIAGPRSSASVCSLGLLRIAMDDEDGENTPDLSIPPEKVCYIVVTDPDDGSNPSDDAMVAVLEDHRDDPVVPEITAAIFAMSEDEQIDLVTLAWLGRVDGSLEDWDELRAEAARAHNKRTALYLRGMPLLADYLDEALAQFGHSCDE